MINIFVNTTTYGQALGATFNLGMEGALSEKRITSDIDILVQDPVYERVLDTEKITSYAQAGQSKKVENAMAAVKIENIRVNALNVLVRELTLIETLEYDGFVQVFVPVELLDEIQTGKHKPYSYHPELVNPYYSEFERELWRYADALIGRMYERISIKSIAVCRSNRHDDPIHAERVQIVRFMQSNLSSAYKEMAAIKAKSIEKQKETTAVIW